MKRLIITNSASKVSGVAAALLMRQAMASGMDAIEDIYVMPTEELLLAYMRRLLTDNAYSSIHFLGHEKSEKLMLELHAMSFNGETTFRPLPKSISKNLVADTAKFLQGIPKKISQEVKVTYFTDTIEGNKRYSELFAIAESFYQKTGDARLFRHLVSSLSKCIDAKEATRKEKLLLQLARNRHVFGLTRMDVAKMHCHSLRQIFREDNKLDNALPYILEWMRDKTKKCWQPSVKDERGNVIRFNDDSSTIWSPEEYDIAKCRIHGNSYAMERLRQAIDRDNGTLPVLIEGENGAGKTSITRSLHLKSANSFVRFGHCRCAGLDSAALRDAIFGHIIFNEVRKEKSFDPEGLLSLANNGTLFLEEIGEMDLETQSLLLQFLDSGEYRPIGSAWTSYSNARIIASSSRPLKELVTDGKFLPALYWRLSQIHFCILPLREHKEDIAFIANDFWSSRNNDTLSTEQLAALQDYDWPGNITELLTLLNRASATGQTNFAKLLKEHQGLQAAMTASQTENALDTQRTLHPPKAMAPLGDPHTPLADVVRQHVYEVYQALGARKREAARALGISFNTLQKYVSEMENNKRE